jgi:hypothetical protein
MTFYEFYSPLALYGLDRNIFKRAFELAGKLSFIHINGALHLACAEKYARHLWRSEKAVLLRHINARRERHPIEHRQDACATAKAKYGVCL